MPIETAYGTANQSLTMTLNSLASSLTAARQSAEVSNATPLSLDALVFLTLVIGTGTIANDQCAYVYAFGTVDDGTTRTEGAGASDAAITLFNPTNLPLIGVVNMPTASSTYRAGPFSVARAFGGILPARWGIVVRNYCGIALSGSGNSAIYQLIEATVT
jgi:hypothetical protein